MLERNRKLTLRVAHIGLMTTLSILLLMAFPGIPLIASANFLKYDAMDIPMVLTGLVMGPVSGLIVLFLGCLLQTLLFGQDGVIGFLMHFLASGMLVLVSSYVFKFKRSRLGLMVALVLGTLSMALFMIPLNYWISVPYLSAIGVQNAKQMVSALMWPAIVPFNLLKAGINSGFVFFLMMTLWSRMERLSLRFSSKE